MIKSLGKATDEELGVSPSSPTTQTSGGILQKGSDFLRNSGLGIIPDAVGAAYEIPRAIKANVSGDYSGYGHRNTQGNWVEPENPFIPQERLAEGSTLKGAATNAVKDFAGAASWAVPITKGGIAARGVLGGASGALQGFSQEDANLQSVGKDTGVSAILSALLPGGSRMLQSLGFKGATGKGLKTLEKAEQQSGQKLTATSRQGMKGQLRNIQDGLASSLEDLMAQGGTMTMKEVGDHLDGFLDPTNPLYTRLGPSEKKNAQAYVRVLKNDLDDIVKSFKNSNETITASGKKAREYGSGNQAGNPNYRVYEESPVGSIDNALGPFYAFMKRLEGDIPQNFYEKFNAPRDAKTQAKVAGEMRGYLRKALSDKSTNPAEFENIMKSKQNVGSMQADITGESFKKSAGDLLRKAGIPLGGLPLGLVTGNPVAAGALGATVGFMTVAERFPQIAPMIRNLLDDPKTAAAGNALIRILTGGINK